MKNLLACRKNLSCRDYIDSCITRVLLFILFINKKKKPQTLIKTEQASTNQFCVHLCFDIDNPWLPLFCLHHSLPSSAPMFVLWFPSTFPIPKHCHRLLSSLSRASKDFIFFYPFCSNVLALPLTNPSFFFCLSIRRISLSAPSPLRDASKRFQREFVALWRRLSASLLPLDQFCFTDTLLDFWSCF